MQISNFCSILILALVCDARLNGIQQGDHSARSHRKLEADISSNDPRNNTDQFIVILKGEDRNLKSFEARLNAVGGSVLRFYRNIFRGAAIEIHNKAALFQILDDDVVSSATTNQHLASSRTQRFPPWGLDRLDEAIWPLNNRYDYEFDGTDVHVYVLDTGVRVQHKEFGGRARCAFNAIEKETCADQSTHGTHVAALVGGKTFGVAKNVTIQSVKVLDKDGDGTFADLLAGLDYVVGMKLKKTPERPMVINLSLNGGKSNIINEAIQVAIDAGIVVVAAAGNDRDDACHYSPGSAKNAITVGATAFSGFAKERDRRADFSNTGDCVDIFAPGEDIVSASDESNLAIRTLSGTSMAAPFVAGAAALYLQRDPTETPSSLWETMQRDSRKGRLELFQAYETPNMLLSTKGIVSRKQ